MERHVTALSLWPNISILSLSVTDGWYERQGSDPLTSEGTVALIQERNAWAAVILAFLYYRPDDDTDLEFGHGTLTGIGAALHRR